MGGDHGEGGCENPPFIEFCSAECFDTLASRIEKTQTVRAEELAFLRGHRELSKRRGNAPELCKRCGLRLRTLDGSLYCLNCGEYA